MQVIITDNGKVLDVGNICYYGDESHVKFMGRDEVKFRSPKSRVKDFDFKLFLAAMKAVADNERLRDDVTRAMKGIE